MGLNSRKKKISDYVLFDVLYEDGSRTSNRKIPATELAEHDVDRCAKAFVLSQDRKIAEASGISRGAVKSVVQVKR